MRKKIITAIINILATVGLFVILCSIYGIAYLHGSINQREYDRKQVQRYFDNQGIQPDRASYTGELLNIYGYPIHKLERVWKQSTSKHLGTT